ncbi:hypothetical protein [Adhaeribacter pallidiroseus]|uniref:Uncharacterized protein n=1 Tax=Adhaeribacter pallidiroseus TaxID=2072847 RepID=A0A369QC00_9BACT|nr:hypothetical protein [Adhaeribacter pallidiroseus]RDC61870.1 hypothetical protein AHMF7616_00459 [Adhaeribacter pallidiroseus]
MEYLKNYSSHSLISLLLGWLVSLVTHSIWGFFKHGSLISSDTLTVGFWSFFFLLIAYGLFIQLPEKLITKALYKYNLITFSICSTFYALTVFTLMIGWAFFLYSNFYVVFLDAGAIGLVFGLSFWSISHKKDVNRSKLTTKNS